MAKKNQTAQTETIWVLVDAPSGGDLVQYAGPLQIDVEKLGQHFETFTRAISKAIEKANQPLGTKKQYELTEITLEAKLSAEVGFTLVSKGGVEGTFGFKFERKKRTGSRS
jgi:hypothetical protein